MVWCIEHIIITLFTIAHIFFLDSVCRENRYLLFLTENDAALEIMHRFLFQSKDTQPYVLFGSSFPKDKDYTQVCMLHYFSFYIISYNYVVQHVAHADMP